MITRRIDNLTKHLRDTINNDKQTESEIQLVSTHIRKEITELTRLTHQRNRDHLAAVDAAEGEKIGKTWSNRHEVSKPRDTIMRLKTSEEGATTSDPKEMATRAAEYHEEIQSQGLDPRANRVEEERERILGLLRARLSDKSKVSLGQRISELEVRQAIVKTNREKAPGLDGILIELWKSLDDQYREAVKKGAPRNKCNVVWVLTQVYQDIEEFGIDTEAGFNQGCMTPIYKKKDPEDITNYRPITLLNTDYKVYTKAISMRLADIVPEVVNADQAGFMSGRSIFDQVKTTKLVIEYMGRTSKKGAIIALDQEKAYDKITHHYLWQVMRTFGFPEKFIGTIAALYTGVTTRVLINGELSPPYPVSRGVRQGDPLSCLLFNLAIELLAEYIRQTDHISGIPIPGKRTHLKIKLFADDTTVFLSENDEVENLQKMLDGWCMASGAKFNIDKTEIIPVGNETQRQEIRREGKLNERGQTLPRHIHIAKDSEPVRILGAWLGNGIDQATTWAPVLEDCCRRLKRWSAAKHSLEGRRLIL